MSTQIVAVVLIPRYGSPVKPYGEEHYYSDYQEPDSYGECDAGRHLFSLRILSRMVCTWRFVLERASSSIFFTSLAARTLIRRMSLTSMLLLFAGFGKYMPPLPSLHTLSMYAMLSISNLYDQFKPGVLRKRWCWRCCFWHGQWLILIWGIRSHYAPLLLLSLKNLSVFIYFRSFKYAASSFSQNPSKLQRAGYTPWILSSSSISSIMHHPKMCKNIFTKRSKPDSRNSFQLSFLTIIQSPCGCLTYLLSVMHY